MYKRMKYIKRQRKRAREIERKIAKGTRKKNETAKR